MTHAIYLLLLGAAFAFRRFVDRRHCGRWIAGFGYGFIGAAIGSFVWIRSEPPNLFSDFTEVYYWAGRAILDEPETLYDREITEPAAGGFKNIPIIAFLFAPFTFVDTDLAKWIFTAAGLAAAVTAMTVLARAAAPGNRLSVAALFLINGPLYYGIKEGNVSHFVLMLLVFAWQCLLRKRDLALGALLGLAALIKYPLGLFVFYFIGEQRWRAVAGFGACALALLASSIALLGAELHMIWFREVILSANRPLAAFNVQSLDAFLARLWAEDHLANWNAVDLGREFIVVRYALLCLVLAFSAYAYARSRSRGNRPSVDFSIVLCLSLILSPISWTHYYSWLLLPLSLYWGRLLGLPDRERYRAPFLVAAVLISLPVSYGVPQIPPFRYLGAKILISHYLLGVMLMAGALLLALLGESESRSRRIGQHDLHGESSREKPRLV